MAKYTIDKILRDNRLLGKTLGDPATWTTWIAVLKAAFALPLSAEELEVFNAVAGGRPLPKKRVRELWCVCGRRGGKSRMAAALAIYFALFEKHPKLVAGERGMVLVLAASRDQAQVVFQYTHAFLTERAVLRKEIDTTTQTEIRLKNGITIAIHSNSFRTVRGRTLLVCIADELSFWRDDQSATPDKEVYSAVLPALVTTNGMWVGISSPYRRAGLMYAKHKQYFNSDSDDTLVVQGSSLTFNRTLFA
jgi:phage terminase large subunit-like protein